MKTIGETLKYFRREKGLTQKMVAKDIISTSFLARVERDEHNIAVDLFMKLLEKLNVTFDEFEFVKNDFSFSKKDHLMNSLFMLYSQRKLEELNILERKCLKEYEINGDVMLLHLSAFAYCAARNFDVNRIETSKLIPVTNYLLKQNSWNRYELTLFFNFILFLDEETVYTLGEKLIKKMDKLWSLRYDDSEQLLKALGNIITYCLDHRNLEKADKYLKIFEKRLEGRVCLEDRLKAGFFKGILAIQNGSKEYGLDLCKNNIAIWEALGLDYKAREYNDYLLKFI